MMHRPVAFFDIEASGRDDFPIEIGWAIPHADTGLITTRDALIVPPPAWAIDDRWDEAAEAVHGIELTSLYRRGQSPDLIVRAMNADLAGFIIYADAPAWDLPWLEMLFAASCADRSFEVATGDALMLIGQAARTNRWSSEAFAAVMQEIDRTYPHRHRAGPDAARLAALWLAAGRQPPG